MKWILIKYKPDNSVLQATWLFDDWMPDIPERKGEGKYNSEAIAEVRLAALRTILESRGIAGVLELAGQVKLPQHVGFTLQALALPLERLLEAFQQAINNVPDLKVFAGIVLADGVTRFNDDWMEKVRSILLEQTKDLSRVAQLLMALDDSKVTWEYVASFGEEINEIYWQQKHSFFVQGDADDLFFAVENYLARGRALAALDASSQRFSDVPSAMLFRVLDAAIVEINTSEHGIGTMPQYNIERVFDELEERTDITPDDVANREFAYLPFFRHRKKPLTLHRLMVEQPQLFMEAVSVVFKPAGSELPAPTEGTQRRAVAVYELLEMLHILPGQTGDEVDAKKLIEWCKEVRRLASEWDLAKVTDHRLGHLLAHAPLSLKDQAWPHESVRYVIEVIASDEVEHGIQLERFNMRGVYGKAIGEGGKQERQLALQSKSWAEAMPDFPRTAAMLMRVSDSWIKQAEDADLSAAKDILRW